MAYATQYDTKEAFEKDVATPHQDLYTEKEGKYVLNTSQFAGLKTEADVVTLTTSLNRERNFAKTVKDQLAAYSALGKIEDLQVMKDRFPELEALSGKVDEASIQKLVDAKANSVIAPLQRELLEVKTKYSTLEKENGELKGADKVRKVTDAVRKAATGKVDPKAIDNVLLPIAKGLFDLNEQGQVISRENSGVTPFVSPEVWLTEFLPQNEYLALSSEGGGSKGSTNSKVTTGTENPFKTGSLDGQRKLKAENPGLYAQLKQQHEASNPTYVPPTIVVR